MPNSSRAHSNCAKRTRLNHDWCRRLNRAFAEFEIKAARAGADEKQVIEQQQALLEDGLPLRDPCAQAGDSHPQLDPGSLSSATRDLATDARAAAAGGLILGVCTHVLRAAHFVRFFLRDLVKSARSAINLAVSCPQGRGFCLVATRAPAILHGITSLKSRRDREAAKFSKGHAMHASRAVCGLLVLCWAGWPAFAVESKDGFFRRATASRSTTSRPAAALRPANPSC